MITSRALLLVITIWCSVHIATALKREDYRLPDDIEPIQYDLHIIIPDGFERSKTFQGELQFSFKPTKNLANKHKLLLNQKHLKTTNVTLGDDECHHDNVGVERLEITAPQALTKGTEYKLAIKYKGKLTQDSLTGLYLNSYKEDGKKVYYIATQMEPADARSMFPCLDEPALKATFKVKVTHPADYHSVVNNAAAQEIRKTYTQFEETHKMSTYLVALLVSKFEKQETKKDGLKHRILYRKKSGYMHQYALDITPKIIKVLEDMTGVTYKEGTDNKILKVFQGAVPDFPSFAMENWGLILYRELVLLWDKEQSGTKAKKGVATTIAHELAHMWFGNLKTCKWWSVLWMNEAFAAFFQYYALAKIETSWELENQIVLDSFQSVMVHDTLRHSIPMTSTEDDILNVAQMRYKFGVSTYSKGSCILRMAMMFMGENLFYKGIKTYMGKKIGNDLSIAAGPEDLWGSWKNESELNDILPEGSDLATVMKEWTDSRGFPVVKVTRRNNQVELTTHRWHERARTDTDRASENVWYIPISYTTSNNPNFTNTMVTKKNWLIKLNKLTLDEDLRARNSWIVVNLQSAAYIRVNYDKSLWKALETALKNNHKQIHTVNRAQIVDDVLELSLISQLSYSTSLGVIQYLGKEVDYYPWHSALKGFQSIMRRLDGKVQSFHNFVRPLLHNFYKSVSDDTDHISSLKRAMAISAACGFDISDCKDRIQEQFKDFIEYNKKVDPDTRSTVYCAGLHAKDGHQHWDMLYDRLDKTKFPSEVFDILSALGCVENEEILKSYLEKTLDDASAIRGHDAHYALISVAQHSKIGTKLALKFLVDRIQDILKKYKYAGAMRLILNALADSITTKEQLQQLKNLLNNDLVADHVETIKQAIDLAKENMSWNDARRNSFFWAIRAKMPPKARATRGTGAVETVSKSLLCVPLAIALIHVA